MRELPDYRTHAIIGSQEGVADHRRSGVGQVQGGLKDIAPELRHLPLGDLALVKQVGDRAGRISNAIRHVGKNLTHGAAEHVGPLERAERALPRPDNRISEEPEPEDFGRHPDPSTLVGPLPLLLPLLLVDVPAKRRGNRGRRKVTTDLEDARDSERTP